MSNVDTTQNERLRDLEKRVSTIDRQVSELLGRIDTLIAIGKTLSLLAGVALGIDVLPLIEGGF